MDRLLNEAQPEEVTDKFATNNDKTCALATGSLSTSTASIGFHILSASGAMSLAPLRLPSINFLTATAATLPPIRFQSLNSCAKPPISLRHEATSSVLVASAPANHNVAATDNLLCRYRNKKCWLPRTIKRNGKRHNLCERHRAKANQNQRKLERKRRTQKRILQRMHSQNAARIMETTKDSFVAQNEINVALFSGNDYRVFF
ncbi:hypothetical protein CCR75_003503 [Bremia lactucae]|uniref:Uncharacterized protein n=1 Tax=Bremia lactucae TaxID=4779 RepID=A0A976IGZ3_BRELC|nr:hypothetical protein CCR75_003503 [Bremia lactucae]